MEQPDGIETRHRLGLWLVLASTVPFALAGIFTRLISADLWSVLGWRGLLGGVAILLYSSWLERGQPHRSMGWQGWTLAFVGAGASITFLAAFRMTYVANVTLIYALTPFAAAALDWLIRGERVRRSVMVSAAISTVGVLVIIAGGLGASRLAGDAMALLMVGMFALYTVLIRAFPAAPAIRAGGWSALLLFVPALVFGDLFAVPSRDAGWLVAFGLSFALAVVLFTEGAQRITPAEAGFYGGAETPLAVAFAWLFLSEAPPVATLVGGAVVVIAVFRQGWRDLRPGRGVSRLSSSAR